MSNFSGRPGFQVPRMPGMPGEAGGDYRGGIGVYQNLSEEIGIYRRERNLSEEGGIKRLGRNKKAAEGQPF